MEARRNKLDRSGILADTEMKTSLPTASIEKEKS